MILVLAVTKEKKEAYLTILKLPSEGKHWLEKLLWELPWQPVFAPIQLIFAFTNPDLPCVG